MRFAQRALLAASLLLVPAAAFAQGQGYDPTAQPPPPQQPAPGPQTAAPAPDATPQAQGEQPQPPPGAPPQAAPPAVAVNPDLLLDGHVRSGAFLAGPGSLNFIIHHSILGTAGGLVTMGIASGFRFDQQGAREGMLAGALIGAGVGFVVSAWWQYAHWIGSPAASFGIVNSAIAGMALAGLMDFFSDDKPTLAWTALIGAELGAWLTVGLGGGEFELRRGVAMTSAAGWAMAYTALLIAITGFSSTWPAIPTTVDLLLAAPGVGALGMALLGMRFDPSVAEMLRADLFGAGVGGAVLVLSALVLGGFGNAMPYVLSLLSSAGAITAVSVFWVEAAERHLAAGRNDGRMYYRSKDADRPYSNPWW